MRQNFEVQLSNPLITESLGTVYVHMGKRKNW